MAKRQDIDAVLKNWKFDPQTVSARSIRGPDGRELLQLRIDLGLLQLEAVHRPDGDRPHEFDTYYDYLRSRIDASKNGYTLNTEECAEVDREFVQFYHRRICWLVLHRFSRAVRDADHSLALMNLVRQCSPHEQWAWSHEQYRPFILFHRTQASALAALEEHDAEAAIEEINVGEQQIRQHLAEDALFQANETDQSELLEKLNEMRDSLREHYGVQRTLEEQLRDAVEAERYELAAKLRDEISRRRHQDSR